MIGSILEFYVRWHQSYSGLGNKARSFHTLNSPNPESMDTSTAHKYHSQILGDPCFQGFQSPNEKFCH